MSGAPRPIRLPRLGERLAAAGLRRLRQLRERLREPTPPASHRACDPGSPPESLEGRAIAITGSSRGVGLALAEALARAGARITLNGRSEEPLRAAAARLQRRGGRLPLVVAADIGTAQGARELIERTASAHGRLDALVNNAALLGPPDTPLWTLDDEDWDRVLGANLRGPFLCAREALRWWTSQGSAGRIVNVSSGAGRMPAPGLAAYTASKHGLEGLTRALAREAEGVAVSVCAVELGPLRTQMTREVTLWEDHVNLPPPDTALPVLLDALQRPAAEIQGRVFAAWRHSIDPAAERRLARPAAASPKAAFEPLIHRGAPLLRTDPGVEALDRAENPLGMPPRVRALLANPERVGDLSRYPDEHYPRLRAALSERLGIPPAQLSFGPGSVELVERCVRCFLGPGDEVVSNDPSWFMFDRFCALAEAVPRKVAAVQRGGDGPFLHSLPALAKAVGPQTRLVYLVSPSNPFASGIEHAEFQEFLAAIPSHVPVVIDEAYEEFSENPERLRTAELARDSERCLIGLRTFSKFYALAALRIGYAYGSAPAIALLERLEPLFALSSLAEAAAVEALRDAEHARATRELVVGEKRRLRAELARLGVRSLPSETHLLLVQGPLAPGEIDRVYAAFADRGALLPRGLVAGRYWLLPVLRPEQNDRSLEILQGLARPRRAATT